jgi:hypothetical protein
MPRSYLDHQATTPLDPRVLEAILPYSCEKFGNAASRTHRWGLEAEKAVEGARGKIAALEGGTGLQSPAQSGRNWCQIPIGCCILENRVDKPLVPLTRTVGLWPPSVNSARSSF